MNIVIFSRDRASQLELLLRSIKKYFKEWNEYKIYILYTYTNKDFEKGYEITKGIHPEFNYVKEESFKNDLIKILDEKLYFTTFFVDDNIFKDYFTIKNEKIELLKTDINILCLSLRLHPRLTYCYPAKIKMSKPIIDKQGIFKWTGERGDFGYPMSLDGNIFRTNDILPLIKKLNYRNPNSLESILSMIPLKKPYMIMFEESKIINNPVNRVQDFNNNIYGNVPAKYINEQFLKGLKISIDNIHKIENISCHQEIDILFE